MTEEQRKLVEDNHNLIYSFLQKYHLTIDEYYGLAAIGLCKAGKTYNGQKWMHTGGGHGSVCDPDDCGGDFDAGNQLYNADTKTSGGNPKRRACGGRKTG